MNYGPPVGTLGSRLSERRTRWQARRSPPARLSGASICSCCSRSELAPSSCSIFSGSTVAERDNQRTCSAGLRRVRQSFARHRRGRPRYPTRLEIRRSPNVAQAVLLGSTDGPLFLALLVTIYLARVLSPAAFGFFSLVGTVFILARKFLDLGMGSVAARDIARDARRERPILEGMMAYRRAGGIALALGMLIFAFRQTGAERAVLLAVSAVLLLSPNLPRSIPFSRCGRRRKVRRCSTSSAGCWCLAGSVPVQARRPGGSSIRMAAGPARSVDPCSLPKFSRNGCSAIVLSRVFADERCVPSSDRQSFSVWPVWCTRSTFIAMSSSCSQCAAPTSWAPTLLPFVPSIRCCCCRG